jgi:PmbA protein
LTGFLYDTYAARLAGVSSTGSAVRGGFRTTPGVGALALTLEPGTHDQSEIIAQVGEGFLVQSITGVHSGVNRVSGDFSVGAEGLMIRGGELAEPVREVTIASTIQRMLQHVVAIGSDIEWLPGSATGVTLAIDEVAMSGA